MKKVFSFLLLSICSSYLSAQTQPEHKVDSVKLKKFLQQEWVKDLMKRQQQSYIVNDTAYYSHNVLSGKVYHLPQDGMPCLRPDTSMYVYNEPKVIIRQIRPFTLKDTTKLDSPVLGNNMPNAYRQGPLVWGKKP